MKRIVAVILILLVASAVTCHAGPAKRSVKEGLRAFEGGDYWSAVGLALDGLDDNPKLKKGKKLLAEVKDRALTQKLDSVHQLTDPIAKADGFLEIDRFLARCSQHGCPVDPGEAYAVSRDAAVDRACGTLYERAATAFDARRFKAAHAELTAVRKYRSEYKDCSKLIQDCLEMGRVRVKVIDQPGPHQAYVALLSESIDPDIAALTFTTDDEDITAPTTLDLKIAVDELATQSKNDVQNLNVYYNHVTRHEDGSTTTHSSSETVRLRSEWKEMSGSLRVEIVDTSTGDVFSSKRFPIATELGQIYIDSSLRDPARAYSVFNAEKVERARKEMDSGGDTVDKLKAAYEVYDSIKDETRKDADFEARYGFPFTNLIIEYESYQRTGKHASLPSDMTLFRRAMATARVWIQDQLQVIDSTDFTAN